jgi:hypothetical protein
MVSRPTRFPTSKKARPINFSKAADQAEDMANRFAEQGRQAGERMQAVAECSKDGRRLSPSLCIFGQERESTRA